MLYAKTLAGKLNLDVKANLNGHPSICHSIQICIGLKSHICMEDGKIISLTNLFQHSRLADILSELKVEFILPYLVRSFQINVPPNILSLYKTVMVVKSM